jgi:hypothetical protein
VCLQLRLRDLKAQANRNDWRHWEGMLAGAAAADLKGVSGHTRTSLIFLTPIPTILPYLRGLLGAYSRLL